MKSFIACTLAALGLVGAFCVTSVNDVPVNEITEEQVVEFVDTVVEMENEVTVGDSEDIVIEEPPNIVVDIKEPETFDFTVNGVRYSGEYTGLLAYRKGEFAFATEGSRLFADGVEIPLNFE